jgi:HK97 gp10 family phage protein
MARKSSIQHRRLSRLLRRLPDDVREPIKEAIAEGAQKVLLAAKEKVPKKTWTLHNAITGKLSRSGLSAEVGILTKTAKRKAYYAHFVEFGTAGYKAGDKRYYKSKGKVYSRTVKRNVSAQPARPFLHPALEENKADIIKEIDTAVNSALQKASKG